LENVLEFPAALATADEPSGTPLVRAAQRGDPAAFDALYAQYARVVHGILLARVPRQETQDLVQDVFLQAWRNLHTLRDARAFPGWVAMIARNRATDWHRRAPLTVEVTERTAVQPPTPPEAVQVLETIRSLPEAYRETLLLRLVEGMSGPEIAERTGLTHDSVRVNLHRGMKMLREKLS